MQNPCSVIACEGQNKTSYKILLIGKFQNNALIKMANSLNYNYSFKMPNLNFSPTQGLFF